jgi:hypothetical protein
MKTKTQAAKHSSTRATLKNGTKPKKLRVFIPERLNRSEYHFREGRHVVTLTLGEGLFTMLRLVASSYRHQTPEEYILDSVCTDAVDMVGQITNEEVEKLVEWPGEEKRSGQMPTPKREIRLVLDEQPYTILAGIAAAQGYDSVEHMILKNESSLAAQSPGDSDENEYAEMFGLKVEAGGETRLLKAQSK